MSSCARRSKRKYQALPPQTVPEDGEPQAKRPSWRVTKKAMVQAGGSIAEIMENTEQGDNVSVTKLFKEQKELADNVTSALLCERKYLVAKESSALHDASLRAEMQRSGPTMDPISMNDVAKMATIIRFVRAKQLWKTKLFEAGISSHDLRDKDPVDSLVASLEVIAESTGS